MPSPIIFATGGAHIDRRGRVSGIHVPEASNPGVMEEEVGGGAFNASCAIARRGCEVRFFSTRGGDSGGEAVARAIEEAGLEDLSATHLDRQTASYTAILDEKGDLVTALADMAIYENCLQRNLRRRKLREAIATSDAVLCDANLPEAALATLAEQVADQPLFAIAISPAKVLRLNVISQHLSVLFMNRREAKALLGMAQDENPDGEVLCRKLAKAGLYGGVISDGGRALFGFESDRLFSLVPPQISQIADVTGAGDALAGATIAARMRGLNLEDALREGLAASALTILSSKAVARFRPDEFAQMVREIGQAQFIADMKEH
ncbi:carbohydrate kinase family protein [Nitratireductor basaltis]|uniref:PfkB domain protein n=1 Tax=Nitratireductor basaltis TaxID=472175 RepID=A0A084UBH2_9HYPH|nr:carbohydrate kinase family protein [Nitratireductor basaltis]KFB10308.1 PfkB domain protein [Nitratireductor basaltis]